MGRVVGVATPSEGSADVTIVSSVGNILCTEFFHSFCHKQRAEHLDFIEVQFLIFKEVRREEGGLTCGITSSLRCRLGNNVFPTSKNEYDSRWQAKVIANAILSSRSNKAQDLSALSTHRSLLAPSTTRTKMVLY
jgi:hypothetical protein